MEENKELTKKNVIKLQKELEKLDRDYFHICVEVDVNNNVKWQVYYSNMNDKDYLKRNNKPILDSINNSVDDIEKLNKKFKKIKEKATLNMFLERFDLSFEMFKLYRNITEIIQQIFNGFSYCILALLLILFILNLDPKIFAAIGTMILTFTAILALLTSYYQDKVQKHIDELKEKQEKSLIKAYLKDKDMRGLKYEFTEKNRKKFIKENQEYRSKRKRIQSGMERLEGIQRTENEQ